MAAVKAGGSAVKGAMAKAKSKAAGAAVDASLAYDAAKKKAGEVKKAVSDAPTKVARASARGTEKVEKKVKSGIKGVKSGIKGMIGRAAKKVASKASGVAKRMSEEIEALKSSGKFSDKEIEAFIAIDENRRAARAAGGYKDDSKKQPDPSKDGFTGIGNMSISIELERCLLVLKKKRKSDTKLT